MDSHICLCVHMLELFITRDDHTVTDTDSGEGLRVNWVVDFVLLSNLESRIKLTILHQ